MSEMGFQMKGTLLPDYGSRGSVGLMIGPDTDAARRIQNKFAEKGLTSKGGSGSGLQVTFGQDMLALSNKSGSARLVASFEASAGIFSQSAREDGFTVEATRPLVRVGGAVGPEIRCDERLTTRLDAVGGYQILYPPAPYVGARISVRSNDPMGYGMFMQGDQVVSGVNKGDTKFRLGATKGF